VKMFKSFIAGELEVGETLNTDNINGVIEWIFFAFIIAPLMIILVMFEFITAIISLIASVIFMFIEVLFVGSYERLIVTFKILGVYNG